MDEKIREPRYVTRAEADETKVGDTVVIIGHVAEENVTLSLSVTRGMVAGVPDPVWAMATPSEEKPVLGLLNLDPLVAYMEGGDYEVTVRFLLIPGQGE